MQLKCKMQNAAMPQATSTINWQKIVENYIEIDAGQSYTKNQYKLFLQIIVKSTEY